MNKFVYRVQNVEFGDFTTEFMNSCFEDGESLVAIVPFGNDAKIITMKRVPVPVSGPTLAGNDDVALFTGAN